MISGPFTHPKSLRHAGFRLPMLCVRVARTLESGHLPGQSGLFALFGLRASPALGLKKSGTCPRRLRRHAERTRFDVMER